MNTWKITVSEHDTKHSLKRCVMGWYTASNGFLKVSAGGELHLHSGDSHPPLPVGSDINSALEKIYKRSGGVMLYCPIVEYH